MSGKKRPGMHTEKPESTADRVHKRAPPMPLLADEPFNYASTTTVILLLLLLLYYCSYFVINAISTE